MSDLIRGYGRGLVAVFFAAVALWALMLIILPQLTMLERAVTAPKRQLDSSIAAQLRRDAQTCASVLKTYEAAPDATAGTGGMAVPSASQMAVPSASTMTTGGESDESTRPYILQCDRATTHVAMVRGPDADPVWLDEEFGLPLLAVSDGDPIPDQIATAKDIAQRADALFTELQSAEANAFPYTLDNFDALFAARQIPVSAEQKAIEDATLSKTLYRMIGLRFDRDGAVYERIGLITLTRTLVFAVMATALALVLCYPIAYKVALATPPDRAVWLFLGLIIPYAIVELMRVYAWTTIIDNQGLLNGMMQWLGLISEPIQFKRMPGTIFVVIVYTYVLFMVFPIYNVMNTLDRNQIEAAKDLGAGAIRVHRRIIIPHAKPGIAVGCIATFMLAAGAFSVPRIISRGLQAEWFSQTIYNKFFESENSNIGAAYSFTYTLVCFVLVGLFMWAMRTRLKDFARVQ
ncbi:spermidine/putrescine transport system permease protein [Roseovarius sp. MBR-78]|jgi:spermidine/putrescine transport system permease protein|uniref:ABC transporter permease subunit n=1 Tax=Roseovarius sp. MBR-78 TaxID=3156460 RepID=UPI003390BA86